MELVDATALEAVSTLSSVSSRLIVRTNFRQPLCVRTELLDLGAGVLRVAAAPPSGGEKSTALWLALNWDNLGLRAIKLEMNHPVNIHQACREAALLPLTSCPSSAGAHAAVTLLLSPYAPAWAVRTWVTISLDGCVVALSLIVRSVSRLVLSAFDSGDAFFPLLAARLLL